MGLLGKWCEHSMPVVVEYAGQQHVSPSGSTRTHRLLAFLPPPVPTISHHLPCTAMPLLQALVLMPARLRVLLPCPELPELVLGCIKAVQEHASAAQQVGPGTLSLDATLGARAAV